jgi:ParB/RepB/Spo0J family partition protein
MKGKSLRKKIAELKRRPRRENNGTREELMALARSWLERAVHPIVCRSDLTVVDGHRRLEGLELLGETEADVFVTDEDLTEADMTQIALSTAIHRADLTPYEKYLACRELIEMNGWQGKELAEYLHLDPSTVTRLLSPSKLIPEAMEALRAGKLDLSSAYAVAKLPPEGQPGLLALRMSGASRDQVERAGRRQRASTAPAVRASKITIALTSGAKVTVTGDDLSLDDAIEAVKDATKEMVKGRDQGLDAKTLVAVCRAKAKAG